MLIGGEVFTRHVNICMLRLTMFAMKLEYMYHFFFMLIMLASCLMYLYYIHLPFGGVPQIEWIFFSGFCVFVFVVYVDFRPVF
jgi:hypothetical protein